MSQQRQTKQRQAIENLLKHSNRPLLPNELLVKAQEVIPRLGVATVFRTLKKLQDEGVVSIVHLPGDSPRYEYATLVHHHHFKCDSCDNVFEVAGCLSGFEKLLPEGFQLTGHDVVLYGRCADCSASK